jgi:hypothetical protein
VRNGAVEIPPPGTMTNMESSRNVVRSAFGCASMEWLTLVRVGPQNSCRGVLALVSNQSIFQAIEASKAWLSAKPEPKKSKAAKAA